MVSERSLCVFLYLKNVPKQKGHVDIHALATAPESDPTPVVWARLLKINCA